MINLSNAFKQELYYNRRNYLTKADITLASGQILHLDNARIWSGGFSLEDAVSEDDMFTALGSTIIGAATLVINNMDEAYSSYDFTAAEAVLYVGLNVQSGGSSHTEWVQKGVYTVDETRYNGGTVTLTMLDNMAQFDRPYSTSALVYPATLGDIVRDACLRCGVSLNTYEFPHRTYSVKKRPLDGSVTYREVIGWAAAIAGCFARCSRDGRLELKWFDQTALEHGSLYTNNGLHYIRSLYSQDISMDDVVITGIRVTVKDETENSMAAMRDYTSGNTGYIIAIEDNEFITTETAQDVAAWLGSQLIGLQFRKASVTHVSDPSIEAGDVGILTDRKGREHPVLITRTNFSATGPQAMVCGAETPMRNSATRYGWETKAYVEARSLLKKEETQRAQMLQDLNERLAAHSGLYSTIEPQESGGSIYYMHDMPTLAESKIVWKMTRDAWGVTTDYKGADTVWNGGMTVDGDAIVRILSAIGINAEWIDAGSLRIGDSQNTIFIADLANKRLYIDVKDNSGNQTILLDSATGKIDLRVNSFTLQGQTIQQIADASASSAVGGIPDPTADQIMDALTNGGKTQGIFITADGRVYIDMTYLRGGTIKLGGSSNGNGALYVYNASGETIMKADKDGLDLRHKYEDNIGYVHCQTVWKDGGFKTYTWRHGQTEEDKVLRSFIRVVGTWKDEHEDGVIGLDDQCTVLVEAFDNNGKIGLKGNSIMLFNKNGERIADFGTSSSAIFSPLTLPGTDFASDSASTTYPMLGIKNNTVQKFYINGSSERYKNVGKETAKKDIEDAYGVNVYQASYKAGYLPKGDQREGSVFPMFVAEQMYEHLPIAVDLNNEGKPENWNHRIIIPIMFQMIKSQKETIDAQEQRISGLEKRIERLEALLS